MNDLMICLKSCSFNQLKAKVLHIETKHECKLERACYYELSCEILPNDINDHILTSKLQWHYLSLSASKLQWHYLLLELHILKNFLEFFRKEIGVESRGTRSSFAYRCFCVEDAEFFIKSIFSIFCLLNLTCFLQLAAKQPGFGIFSY